MRLACLAIAGSFLFGSPALASDCKSAVKNIVNVMGKAQGSKAFFKEKHVPDLTRGCERSATDSELLKCGAKASDLSALQKCGDINKAVKTWAKNAG